jgi:hypothetical protein
MRISVDRPVHRCYRGHLQIHGRPAPRPSRWMVLVAWAWVALVALLPVGLLRPRPISEAERRLRVRLGLPTPALQGAATTPLYWVGGTGNWSNPAHWASTSTGGGTGTGGAGTPTSSNDVIFDGGSGAGTVTIDVAANCNSLTMSQAGLNVTLANTLSVVASIDHNNATLNTAGYAVTAVGLISNGNLLRTLTLGSSTLNLGAGAVNAAMWDSSGQNLTLSAASSTLILNMDSTTSINPAFNANNQTFMDITLTGNGDIDFSFESCTCRNFTRIGTAQLFTQMAWGAISGCTITGTLTLHGADRTNLMGLRSGANYTYCYINAAHVDLKWCSFFEIVVTGPTWTGVELSDGQGNTGIDFSGSPSRTLYWVPGGTGNWGDANNWSLSSGGTAGAPRPVAQDDVVFDANSVTADGATLNMNVRWLCRNLDCSALAHTLTMTLPPGPTGAGAGVPNTALTWASFGSVTLSSLLTLSVGAGAGEWSFRDQRNTTGAAGPYGTITCNGCTIPCNTRVSTTGPAKFIVLGGAGLFGANIQVNGGTFQTNGFPLTMSTLNTSAAATAINVAGSTITLATSGTLDSSGPGPWTGTSTCNLNLTGPNPNAYLGGNSWGAITIASTVTGNCNLGNNSKTAWNPSGATASSLTFTGPANQTCQLLLSCPLGITGALSITGNSQVNRPIVQSNFLGTSCSVTAGSVSLSNVDFMDIAAGGAAGTWTGTMLGNCQGNSGITFTAGLQGASAMKWGGARTGTSLNWNNPANWVAGRVPMPQDDVLFDGVWTGAVTVTAGVPRLARNVDFTGITSGTMQFINVQTQSMYGSLTLSSALIGNSRGPSFAGTTEFAFRGRPGSFTVTWAGVQPTGASGFPTLRFACPGGNYTLLDVLSTQPTRTLTLDGGTLHLGGINHTVGAFVSQTNLTRLLDLGAATLTLTGVTSTATAPVWNAGVGRSGLTVSGTGIIDVTDTSAAVKVFGGGGNAYPTLRHRATGAGGLSITGNNSFAFLDVECTTARSLTLPASGVTTLSGATLQGASGQSLSVVSSTPGVPTWIRRGRTVTITRTNATLSADVHMMGVSVGFPLAR